MEHKFTEEQANQIIDNVSERVEAGETELKHVVAEETQKIINQASAKTLTELNAKFEKELNAYFKNTDKIKQTYDKYFNSDRYSDIEQDRQKQLMEMEINTDINELDYTLNYEVDKFIKSLETDIKTTSSMDYQIKLGNVLKLLEIEPNLPAEYFDFMIEAKDFKLLSILKNKYNSQNLMILSTVYDKKQIEKIAKRKAKTIISYLRQGENFVPRNVLFETLK